MISPAVLRLDVLHLGTLQAKGRLRARSFGIFRNKNIFRNIFRIYSGYIPAILLLGAEKPEWKSRYSGMRIAPKQTLTCIIPIILIPD